MTLKFAGHIGEMIIEVDGDWSVSGATRAKGCAFVHERFLRSADIATAIESCDTKESWLATISSMNGSFAVVTGRINEVWAAVDRVRSIPLFYGLHQGSLVVSDRAERVRARTGDDTQSPETSLEFLLTGYVTGPETLFPNVRQIQAGEMLSFVPEPEPKLERRRYYEWRHRDPWREDTNTLLERLHAVHHGVARRLIASLEGRQAVVPLSGGYDSRLIAVMLKERGYGNVLCYSYGLPDNWEARISREVARYLGFRWEFVPYSGAKWREWGATSAFKRYCAIAGNLSSVPHVQDWPAVFALQQQKAIAVDGVLVPGHSGDFVAGSHIPHWFARRSLITRDQLLRTIFDSHYSLWDWPHAKARLTEELTRRIDAIGGPLRNASPAEAADQLEFWDINERQAKFICNSVRVYDFFGHDWRLPLFDLELLDFWSHVPVEMRVGRRLYGEYVDRYQKLPVSTPNRDRGKLSRALIYLVNNYGLRRLAKAAQYRLRRAQWKSVYERCSDPPLAWFTLIDRDSFRRTYNGKQTLHAYLARLGAQGLLREVTDSDSPVRFS